MKKIVICKKSFGKTFIKDCKYWGYEDKNEDSLLICSIIDYQPDSKDQASVDQGLFRFWYEGYAGFTSKRYRQNGLNGILIYEDYFYPLTEIRK